MDFPSISIICFMYLGCLDCLFPRGDVITLITPITPTKPRARVLGFFFVTTLV